MLSLWQIKSLPHDWKLHKMSDKIFIDVIGWLGAALLLFAYFLVSSKRCPGDSMVYQSLNIGGSALLMINAGYYRAFPSVFVHVVWIFIGVFTVWMVLKGQFKKNTVE